MGTVTNGPYSKKLLTLPIVTSGTMVLRYKNRDIRSAFVTVGDVRNALVTT